MYPLEVNLSDHLQQPSSSINITIIIDQHHHHRLSPSSSIFIISWTNTYILEDPAKSVFLTSTLDKNTRTCAYVSTCTKSAGTIPDSLRRTNLLHCGELCLPQVSVSLLSLPLHYHLTNTSLSVFFFFIIYFVSRGERCSHSIDRHHTAATGLRRRRRPPQQQQKVDCAEDSSILQPKESAQYQVNPQRTSCVEGQDQIRSSF